MGKGLWAIGKEVYFSKLIGKTGGARKAGKK